MGCWHQRREKSAPITVAVNGYLIALQQQFHAIPDGCVRINDEHLKVLICLHGAPPNCLSPLCTDTLSDKVRLFHTGMYVMKCVLSRNDSS